MQEVKDKVAAGGEEEAEMQTQGCGGFDDDY
jgi:hypothetical protein